MSVTLDNRGTFGTDGPQIVGSHFDISRDLIINAEASAQSSFFQLLDTNYEQSKNAVACPAKDTCKWVLEHPTFLRWNGTDPSDVLWLTAGPGCGKSVLSRFLVDKKLVGKSKDTLICYFFFKDDQYRSRSASALCAVLHQIFYKHPALLKKYALGSINAFGDGLKKHTLEMWRILMSITQDNGLGEVVCIFDALDECQPADRNELIAQISDFYNERLLANPPNQLKLFLTSRPYPQIEEEFLEHVGDLSKMHLAGEHESEKIRGEIDLVIESTVTKLQPIWRLTLDEALYLRTRLAEKEHRTYLWLDLIIKELRRARRYSKAKMKELIDKLPNDIEETYEKILQKCTEKEEARRILQIVVAAYRPLTVQEIDVALEIRPDLTSFPDLSLEGSERCVHWIQDLCGLFVSIVDSYVVLIHETAKEFLVCHSSDIWDTESWKNSIDLRNAHAMLAKNCITFLMLSEFQVGDYNTWETSRGRSTAFEDISKKYPFFEYCSFFWHNHVRHGELAKDDWYDKVVSLCNFRFGSQVAWFGALLGFSLSYLLSDTTAEESKIWIDWSELSSSDLLRLPPLYWMLLTGMHELAEFMINHTMAANANKLSRLDTRFSLHTDDAELVALYLYSVRSDIWSRASLIPAMEILTQTWSTDQIMVIFLRREGSKATITEGVEISSTKEAWSEICSKRGQRLSALVFVDQAYTHVQESSCNSRFVRYDEVQVVLLLLKRANGDIHVIEGAVEVAVGNRDTATIKTFTPTNSSRADLDFANIFSLTTRRHAFPQRLIQNIEFLNLWSCLRAIGHLARNENIRLPTLKLFDGFLYWKVSPAEEPKARVILENLQLPKFHWLDDNQAWFFAVRWICVCLLVFDVPTLPLADDALGSDVQSGI